MSATPPSPGILIVDGDENLLVNLRAFLENHRFRVVAARTLAELLSAAADPSLAVAVVDCELERDGDLRLARAVKERLPRLPLVLTSVDFDGGGLEALVPGDGPADCQGKPFSAEQLLRAIREVLQAAGEEGR